MTLCKGFATFKQRGEWVELQFMARAVREGFKVSKPWGDSSAYDVGVESGERILRVQVKSTDCRTQYGYLCQFKPNARSRPYTLKQIDFFAAYVIPEDVWYLIPAAVLLGGLAKKAVTILPEKPRHPERYRYEGFRGAWELMRAVGDAKRSESASTMTGLGHAGLQRVKGKSKGKVKVKSKIKIKVKGKSRVKGSGRGRHAVKFSRRIEPQV